jgi:hypothetical protein
MHMKIDRSDRTGTYHRFGWKIFAGVVHARSPMRAHEMPKAAVDTLRFYFLRCANMCLLTDLFTTENCVKELETLLNLQDRLLERLHRDPNDKGSISAYLKLPEMVPDLRNFTLKCFCRRHPN